MHELAEKSISNLENMAGIIIHLDLFFIIYNIYYG